MAITSASVARPEVGGVDSGHDPGLERRARGVRGEGDARLVLPEQARPARPRPGRGGRTGTPRPGSRSGPRRRSPRRPDAAPGAGRTGRGTGGRSGRRPGRPSSGRPGGRPSGRPRADSAIASRHARSIAPIISSPTAWSGRCSPGGATTVRQLPEARACSSATWTRFRSSSRASSSVPTTWKAKSLRIAQPDAVAFGLPAVLAAVLRLDRGGRPGEPIPMEGAIDDRRDPPAGDRVAAQLEEAGSHRPAQAGRSPTSSASEAAGPTPRRRSDPARATAAGRRRLVRPTELGRDRGRDHAGHPAGIEQLEVGQVRIDVQGDAVERDAPLDPQAERADLARRSSVGQDPAAGLAARAGPPRPRTRGRSRPGPPRGPARRAGRAGSRRARARIG